VDVEPSTRERSPLWLALQQLASKRGVQRADLVEALVADLGELQSCWGVNLKNGNWAARATVRANLTAHVSRLKIPSRGPQSKLSLQDHEQRYRHCILASFNVLNIPELLMTTEIGERRDWLDKPARGELRASKSTSQRYLNDAIDQIEQQIRASGYEPVQADAASDEALPSSPPELPPEPLRTQHISQKKRYAVSAIFGVVAITGGAVYAFAPSSHSSAKQGLGQPARGGSQSAKLETDPSRPLKVDSINQQLSSDLSWVFQKPMSFAPAQLAAISNTHDENAYSRWFARQGAAPLFHRLDQINIEGAASSTSTITDVQVEKTCTAPWAGTLFYSPSAGLDSSPQLAFNLEDPVPVAAQLGNPGEPPIKNFFAGHTISLNPGEKYTLSVNGAASHKYCEYTIKLQVLVGDKTIDETIDDYGMPFRVTGAPNVPAVGAVFANFRYYGALYAGGVASLTCDGVFSPADPKTYDPAKVHACY